MSAWALYLAGLLTLPVLASLAVAWMWCFNRRHGMECYHCDKVLGEIGKNWNITTELRWKAHYLRYWFRSRPDWTCKKVSES